MVKIFHTTINDKGNPGFDFFTGIILVVIFHFLFPFLSYRYRNPKPDESDKVRF